MDCNYSLYLLGRKFVMMGEYLNDPIASATFFEETCAKWELAFFQQVLRAIRDSNYHLDPLVPACLKCRDSVDRLASQFQRCRLSAASEVIEAMQKSSIRSRGWFARMGQSCPRRGFRRGSEAVVVLSRRRLALIE